MPMKMREVDRKSLVEDIAADIETAKDLSEDTPSRELSLVITKLQEARQWAREIITIDKDEATDPHAVAPESEEESVV